MIKEKKISFEVWWEINKKALKSDIQTRKDVALAAWTECTRTEQLPCRKIPYCAKRLKPTQVCDSHCEYYMPYIFTK